MKELTIGSITETAVERTDYPPERVRQILKDETVAILGYGVQGRGQSLNLRDNGVKVIVGQRKGGKAYDLCLQDGWVPGQTLFDPQEAAAKGTVVQYLLSDAGQKETVPAGQATDGSAGCGALAGVSGKRGGYQRRPLFRLDVDRSLDGGEPPPGLPAPEYFQLDSRGALLLPLKNLRLTSQRTR